MSDSFTETGSPAGRQAASGDAKAGRINLLCFEVGKRNYAINAQHVREIRRISDPTPLPDTPPFVLGVINLRGTVVPVYDLGARFGHGQTRIGPFYVLLIVEALGRLIGLLVAKVTELIHVEPSALQPVKEIDRPADCFIEGLIVRDDIVHAVVAVGQILDLGLSAEGDAAP